MRESRSLSRRQFLVVGSALVAHSALAQQRTNASPEPIIDIHQHVNYGGRSNSQLLAHQRAMGITKTILLPAGKPLVKDSTHLGKSNGLAAQCAGNEACAEFAKEHPSEFYFGANEIPDLDGAPQEISKYLKLGAVIIGESKFGVECDSAEMQRLYVLAQEFDVPVLMHWQFKMYNHGFERFHKMLEKYPRVNFIGHAQTWWANIDKDHKDQGILYPRTRVTAGGLTDRYLADYPNMYGDMSAGSGLNALVRDEEHTRGFFARHQNKLLYGSDCVDTIGRGPGCQGAQTIAAIRRLSPTKEIERKLLFENSNKLFRL